MNNLQKTVISWTSNVEWDVWQKNWYSGCSWQKLRKLELNQEHIWLNFCVYKIQPRIEKSHKNYKWNHQRISENTTNLRICSKKTLHFLCLCIMVHTKKLIMIMQTYICVVWFAWITQFDLIFVICWRHIYLLLRCVHCAHMCPEGVLNWKKNTHLFCWCQIVTNCARIPKM